MSKSIRVDEETHAALTALKREGESYDDLISRLVEVRRKAVSEGAGLWSDDDAAEEARAARERLKEQMGRP
ncbi:MAG: antitoxin VapB family protein [Halolamina sp.]